MGTYLIFEHHTCCISDKEGVIKPVCGFHYFWWKYFLHKLSGLSFVNHNIIIISMFSLPGSVGPTFKRHFLYCFNTLS